MRTKALLGLAALAAGALTVTAQNVYSLNIVGYVNTPLAAGFNLIANPLDNGTNDLNSLFASPGFGDTVYAYVSGAFQNSQYFGSWSSDLVVTPGQGIFYQAGSPFTNTFVGNVLTGSLTNPVPAGFAIKSSMVPMSGTLEALSFPASFGDTVYFYRSGAYVNSQFFGSWNPDLTVGVGEAFWTQVSAAESWVETFNP